MSKGKRSVTVDSVVGMRVRARAVAGEMFIAVGCEAWRWNTVRLSVAKAKRFHAGLGEVIAAAEAQAKKGAQS